MKTNVGWINPARPGAALLTVALLLPAPGQAAVLWSEIAGRLAPDDCLRVSPQTTLIIDGDAVLERLEVRGSVEFQDAGPRSLEASEVRVTGALRVGTPDAPFSNDLEIRLVGASGCAAEFALFESFLIQPLSNELERIVILLPLAAGSFASLGADDERTILVLDDGQLEMYGSDPGLPWTTLASSATGTQMTVSDSTGWTDGDQVVLAPTDFGHDEADEAALAGSPTPTADGESWNLAWPLAFEHYANAADVVPVFGEVGKLNRNVRVYSPVPASLPYDREDCSAGGFSGAHLEFDGAEIRIERPNGGSANAVLEFIEVYNAGKFDRLGHYPIHFHMLDDAAGARVHGVSVHHSANRGIVVHGSRDVVLSDNLVYDAVGHGFYLEEAPAMATIRNRLEGNLAVGIHGCPLEDGDEPPEDIQVQNDISASGFFFTDPRNTLMDNHAGGAFMAGFWYDGGNQANNWNLCGGRTLADSATHTEPLDIALFADTTAYIGAEVYAASGLATTCHGAFVGNTAHSSHVGLWAEQHKYQLVRISEFTAYKTQKNALEMKNRGVTEIVDLRASDNPLTLWPATHAFHTASRPRVLLVDSLIQGESPLRAASFPFGDPSIPFYGVEVYEGRLDVARTAFHGFDDSDPTRGKRAAFGRHQNFPFYSNDADNAIEALSFGVGVNPLYFDDPTTETRDWVASPTIEAASGFQSVMLHDLSGDIAPAPGQWIVANDDFNIPGDSFFPGLGVSYDATANAWFVDDTVWTQGQLLVEWCATLTVIPVGLPRCEWFDPASNEALPARQWNLINADGDDFDIVDEVRFLDAEDCHGFGCTDQLDAEHHRPQGNHNIAAANVRSPGRYYVTFYDDTDTQLLAGNPAFDVMAMQIHLRHAPAGTSVQVGVTVPDAPSCVLRYTDIGMSDGGRLAMTQNLVGLPSSADEWYYDGSGMVYLQLEHGDDEQSVLLVFDNLVVCPN